MVLECVTGIIGPADEGMQDVLRVVLLYEPSILFLQVLGEGLVVLAGADGERADYLLGLVALVQGLPQLDQLVGAQLGLELDVVAAVLLVLFGDGGVGSLGPGQVGENHL